MSLVLDGQGGKGLQLKKNQTHFLKSNFNVLSKKCAETDHSSCSRC